MKIIQVIDGADNATFSLFQATDEEFAILFPGEGQDMALSEDIEPVTARSRPSQRSRTSGNARS